MSTAHLQFPPSPADPANENVYGEAIRKDADWVWKISSARAASGLHSRESMPTQLQKPDSRDACGSAYADLFRKYQHAFDPRHIEAYVLLEYPSLNGVCESTFRREAGIAAACIKVDGIQNAAEALAVSFGL